MWSKYKISKHKGKAKHLPLLVFEEAEFERKKYVRIRCRHSERVVSEWVEQQVFEKLCCQLEYPLKQKASARFPSYCVIDHRIREG